MNKELEGQMSRIGIPAWHDRDYTGKRLTVFCDDVGGSHAERVASIVQAILPDATVYTGNISYTAQSGVVTDCNITCKETGERLPFDEFIGKYGVRLINNSRNGGNHDKDSAIAKFMRTKIAEHNLIVTGSAGNGYGNPIDNPFYGAAVMVTGCNDALRSVYAEDPDIDFTAYTGGFSGTSFAAPFLLGMAGLLVCKWPDITQQEVIDYFAKHCDDIGTAGRDKIFGRGLAMMGNPTRKIVMQVGSKKMMVDGIEYTLDQAPEIVKATKRTLVPLRAPFEAAGFMVGWDESTKTITIER